jgi:glycosyltransferase involved in cell wall biosynthesis
MGFEKINPKVLSEAHDMDRDQKRDTKRVLIFSLAYYPRFVGGAEIAIKEITDRIGRNTYVDTGIEFDMITLRFDTTLPRFERIGNVNVYRIGWTRPNPTSDELLRFPLYLVKVFYSPLAAWKAFKLDRERQYDAVWCMMSYMGFAALFLNFLQRFFRRNKTETPFIVTLQEGDSIEHVTGRSRIRMVAPLYRLVFRRAATVQAISHYLAEFARSMGYEGKTEVVPNGVDLELFTRRLSDTETFELKTSLGKKYTDTFLITTSRLVPKNGIADLIRSLPYLPFEVKLLIAGDGPQEIELKELALSQGLLGGQGDISKHSSEASDRVRFLGFIPHADLYKYLRVSDIFIRPSLSEGFGNSFVEAMAADLPVIATPVGGIPDFLEDKVTGVFCEPENPQSIARAVEKILSNLILRDSIIGNAHRMVAERYDWSLIAREMREKVFERVFSAQRSH